MVNNPKAVHDFTCWTIELDKLKDWCKLYCKKWCFQLEKTKSGKLHYQGRISLKVVKRDCNINKGNLDFNFSTTSTENCQNEFYVTDIDKRLDGPWCDRDIEIYIPIQYRNISLYPFQQDIIDSRLKFNDRQINLIYDPKGCTGKSTIASICELMYEGIDCPPINDAQQLVQSLCDEYMARELRKSVLVLVDLPRAMYKDKLYGIYSALEQIKKGKLYDVRHKYKKWWVDSPIIWVFSNHLPDPDLLSSDRWKIYEIVNKNLILKDTCTISDDDLS